jgi:hypothetical protein
MRRPPEAIPTKAGQAYLAASPRCAPALLHPRRPVLGPSTSVPSLGPSTRRAPEGKSAAAAGTPWLLLRPVTTPVAAPPTSASCACLACCLPVAGLQAGAGVAGVWGTGVWRTASVVLTPLNNPPGRARLLGTLHKARRACSSRQFCCQLVCACSPRLVCRPGCWAGACAFNRIFRGQRLGIRRVQGSVTRLRLGLRVRASTGSWRR